MDTLRVGIIGAGSMARCHLDVIQSLQGVEIVAVSSRGAERLEQISTDYRIANSYRDNEEMLKTAKPDAAIIAASAANIHDVAMLCMKHGVSALIEKPPGLTTVETEGLVRASKQAEGQFMVGLNRRFYGVVQKAKGVIEEAGHLVSILVQYTENLEAVRALNVHPPRVFEHWLAADAIHCIDIFRFFAGDVQDVQMMSTAWRSNAPDSYGALIRFKSGAVGHFVSNLTSPGRWQAILYGYDLRVDLVPLEEASVVRRDGKTSQLPKDEMDVKFKPGVYKQDKYFLDHVREKAPIKRPAATLEDALETMRLVEAIANAKSVSPN